MKDFKGTKGKWEVGRTSNAKSEIYMNGNYRAKVFGYGANVTDEDVANAQLIAAAPELLKELQQTVKALEVIATFGATKPIIDRAKSVIDKALGKDAINK